MAVYVPQQEADQESTQPGIVGWWIIKGWEEIMPFRNRRMSDHLLGTREVIVLNYKKAGIS